MRYIGYNFILDLLNLVAVCGSYCVVADIHLNKGNFAEMYSFFSWSCKVFKVGVALPGRVDTWGVIVGIRARL
jgi:hypothetical protein